MNNKVQFKTSKVLREHHKANMFEKLNLIHNDFNKTVVYNRQKKLLNIINLVNDKMNIDIRSKYRTHPIPDGKKIYCKLAKEHEYDFSIEEISTALGVTHATVLHHLNNFEAVTRDYMKYYIELKDIINNKRTSTLKRKDAIKLALYYRKKLNKLAVCK